ncbi:MAG: DUF1573 domain-containing protein [Bacteroidetes bacterium]|nr:DUF1573 domain-containing protein [Bacteroidota bacterium]MDA1121928.1 DUF1573 domain-containing protein [Bacteroidota bacterium]
MRKILLSIAGFIFACSLQAQPILQFVETTHDFGEVLEADGPITNKFEFTNTGNAPLIINNVKASCGCTTPAWTKEPVMPGQKGFIQAQYNPINRPGSFRKSLTISSNTGSASTVFIAGQVTPKPKTLAETLPTKIGNLRIRSKALNMGTIKNNEISVKKHDLYNESDTPLELIESKTPEYITISFEPATIEPQGSGKIVVSFDPTKSKELGYSQETITIKTNEATDAVKSLNIVTTVVEYFPPMTGDEQAQAPKLTLENKVIEFGKANAGEPVIAEFSFTNSGQQDLNIRDVKTNCNCTKASVENSTIKPGEMGKVKVTFNTEGKKGIQHQQITIFSNDPRNSMQMIALRGSVDSN